VLCAGLVGLSGSTAPATALAPGTPVADVADLREPQVSAAGVEVSTFGARWVPVMNNALEGTTLQAVHAVQRVGDRTVVYWSIGSESEEGVPPAMSLNGRDPARGGSWRPSPPRRT
jgi:hypothetical protein